MNYELLYCFFPTGTFKKQSHKTLTLKLTTPFFLGGSVNKGQPSDERDQATVD